MYQVADAYLEQMMHHGTRRRLSGMIGSVFFSGDDVVKDSFGVTGRATEESNTKIGGVYLGELEMTFVPSFLSKIPRDQYEGKEITISIGLLVNVEGEDPTWVDIPVGVYTIQSPKISKQGVTISGYDHMKKLDKAFKIDSTSGTPFNYLTYMATECGVTLGQSQAEIEAFPNGTEILGLHELNDIETFRDMLYWLAQAMGGFACADRFGNIVIKRFGANNDIEFDEDHRDADVVFSGYTTKWTGVSFIDIDSQMTRYYGLEIDDGLTMNLGANPFLQLGSFEAIERRRRAVLNAISQIQYTPFYCNSARDPIFDLGDEIPFVGGISGNCVGCIMSFAYSLSNYSFEGFGDNPALTNAKSKTDKNISGLIQNTVQNEVTYYNFENLERITFGSEQEVTIATIHFTSAQTTTVKILHEFLIDMVKDLGIDGSIEFRYYLDEQLLAYKPKESLSAIIASIELPESDNEEEETQEIQASIEPVDISITRDYFYILKEVEPYIRHTWEVRIIAHGVSSITIEPRNAHITIEGQRLYGKEYFDGYIEIKDKCLLVDLVNVGAVQLYDDGSVTIIEVPYMTVSDDILLYNISSVEPLEFAEGTGSSQPQIYMRSGFDLLTETDDYFAPESGSGVRFITEGSRGDE